MSFYLIIRGPLGSGKSTISKKLAEEIGAKYVAVDEVLDEHNLTGEKEDGFISQNSFRKVNAIVAPEATETIKSDTPIIFDGNFYWQSAIEDLIERLPYPHEVFTLKVPLDMCMLRDSQRDEPHGKDAAMVVYNKSTSFSYGIEVDASGSLEDILVNIRNASDLIP